MHEGSANHQLSTLGVGERFYFETSLERYANDMRVALVPRSRRAPCLQTQEFHACLLTAVGRKMGDVRYLICIERIA